MSNAERSDHADDQLYHILNDAGRTIAYRPVLRNLVGDIKGAILLQQIIFHYINKERKHFYKFISSSEHPQYRDGDSWEEELGFSADEYRSAISKIATKVTRKVGRKPLADVEPQFGPDPDRRKKGQMILLNRNLLVVYWRESDNMLRFKLNEKLLIKAINEFDRVETDFPVSQNGNSEMQTGNSTSSNGKSPATFNIEDTIEGRKMSRFPGQAPENALDDSISKTWNTTSPATIASISRTLLGQHRKGSKDFEANVNPPATIEEIHELADYFPRVCPGMQLPRDPVKLQDWIYRVRDLEDGITHYRGHPIPLKVKLPSKVNGSPARSVLTYLANTYSEEYTRLEYMMNTINEEIGPHGQMGPGVYIAYGQTIPLNVDIPKSMRGPEKDDDFWDYLEEYCPEEYDRLSDEVDKAERASKRDIEAMLTN